MTTSPATAISSTVTTERVPLRMRLANGPQSGPLDGAWWPQSRDLQTEFADLVDHFPRSVGRVERLLFSRPDWDAAPGGPSIRRIHARRGFVKVGSFPSDDTHLMIVKMLSGQRLRLLVIPCETEPGSAAQIMQSAADDHNVRTASELLGLSGPDQGGIGIDVWNDDGGHESL